MGSHCLVHKNHVLEARFLGVHLDAARPFAEPGVAVVSPSARAPVQPL